MSLNLKVILITYALILIIVTTYILKKGRISEKYSLLWYFISCVILILGIFPQIFSKISNELGFQTMSNCIIAILIALLTFLSIALTVIVSGQKKKTTLLIQEISILKSEIRSNENKK